MFSFKSILSKKEQEPKDVAIDLSYLKDFSNNDLDFEKELLQTSVVDIDEKMKELKSCVSEANTKRIAQICHALKSVFYIIGVEVLHTEFKSIEVAILETGYNASVSDRLKSAEEKWTNAKAGLAKILKDYR